MPEQSAQRTIYNLYLFDQDNGELTRVIKNVKPSRVRQLASDKHFQENFDIKVVNQHDGAVVYSLGF